MGTTLILGTGETVKLALDFPRTWDQLWIELKKKPLSRIEVLSDGRSMAYFGAHSILLPATTPSIPVGRLQDLLCPRKHTVRSIEHDLAPDEPKFQPKLDDEPVTPITEPGTAEKTTAPEPKPASKPQPEPVKKPSKKPAFKKRGST